MMLFLMQMAFAEPVDPLALPVRPDPTAPKEGDCTRTTPLPKGTSLGCDAMAVPRSDLADLMATETWALAVHDVCRINTVAFRGELRLANDREAWWKGVAERGEPKLQPAGWFAIGAGTGVALVVLSAVAVRWAAEVPVTESSL